MSGVPNDAPTLSNAEYERRWTAVRDSFADWEVDATVVTGIMEQQYLTGSDLYGDTAPWPLLMAEGREPTWLVRLFDEDTARAESRITDFASWRDDEDPMRVFADLLTGRGLASARVGMELSNYWLAPADVSRLQGYLPALQIVDTTRLVTSIAEVKSAEEIAVMRAAMGLTRIGISTFLSTLQEGTSESEVSRAMATALRDHGSGMDDPPQVVFGRRSALPHGAATDYRLAKGDVAYTEHSGWWCGYAAGLVRTAILGRNEKAEELYAIADEAQQAAIDAIRPGVTNGSVDAACRGVIERAGKGESFRHRTGYAIGLRWLERANMSLVSGGTDVLREGMTFHMPTILFEKGEFGVGCSETVLVTSTGADVLSGLPRDLPLL